MKMISVKALWGLTAILAIMYTAMIGYWTVNGDLMVFGGLTALVFTILIAVHAIRQYELEIISSLRCGKKLPFDRVTALASPEGGVISVWVVDSGKSELESRLLGFIDKFTDARSAILYNSSSDAILVFNNDDSISTNALVAFLLAHEYGAENVINVTDMMK